MSGKTTNLYPTLFLFTLPFLYLCYLIVISIDIIIVINRIGVCPKIYYSYDLIYGGLWIK